MCHTNLPYYPSDAVGFNRPKDTGKRRYATIRKNQEILYAPKGMYDNLFKQLLIDRNKDMCQSLQSALLEYQSVCLRERR